MKVVYPVVISQGSEGMLVHVPAFDCGTQGKDLADAIYMARDVISVMGITYEDMGKELPEADFDVKANKGEIVTFIDADLTAYRKKYDRRSVKKNCTIPAYLSAEAEKRGFNFSEILKEALEAKLKMA